MSGSYARLKIDDDPTAWRLDEPIAAAELTTSGNAPFRATIVQPRTGTLLLSTQAAASVVLSEDISGPHTGVFPNGGDAHNEFPAHPFLYLPSVTGLTSKASRSWYPLKVGTKLRELERDITTAMSQGQPCTVELTDSIIMLNGANLSFVVFFGAAEGG
jgi:hypothetical protein